MKKPKVAIAIVTCYLLVFQLVLHTDASLSVIFGMLSASPFLILYMVYIILKYGKPSQYTFDERFYDDWDYVRNGAGTNNETP
ncbi:MAG: hypothetical protein ABI594_11100 [Ginsengibacter sp.]